MNRRDLDKSESLDVCSSWVFENDLLSSAGIKPQELMQRLECAV